MSNIRFRSGSSQISAPIPRCAGAADMADLKIGHIQQTPPAIQLVHDPEQPVLRYPLGHAPPVNEGTLVPGDDEITGSEVITGTNTSLFTQ
jgi:hypothetical protein